MEDCDTDESISFGNCGFYCILLQPVIPKSLTRSTVLPPRISPLIRVLHGDEGSFLNLTGMSRLAFATLRDTVFRKRGRAKSLDNNGQSDLLLFFVNSTIKLNYLCF